MENLGTLLAIAALSCAACGEVQQFADAGGDDTTIDASTAPDAAPDAVQQGSVSVTTLTRCCNDMPDQPKPGVDVFVTGPDGAPGDRGQSNAAGQLTLDVTAGDSVTGLYLMAPNGNELITYMGVKPGDSFTFGEKFSTAQGNPIGDFTVSWPNLGANINSYSIRYPCGGTGTGNTTLQATFTEYDSCHVSPMDILFMAYDTNGTLVRWGLLNDVNFVAGGSAALGAWQSPGSIQLSVSGLPSVVTQVQIQAQGMLNGGNSSFYASASGAPVNGGLSQTQPWTTGGDGIMAIALLGRNGNFGFQEFIKSLPATSTTVSFASPPLLPWLGQTVTNSASGQVDWIQDGELGPGDADATVFILSWNDGNTTHRWNVVAPPGIRELRLPRLPAQLAQYAPPSGVNINVNGGILQLSADDGYDDFRARPEWEATLNDEAILMSGSIGVSIFGGAN
ncbi:MAG: hypothetical protein KC464_09750 [Myxococcales bacterium]|nr:hypothetical protein [Myxococcales bacterium]